MNRLIRIAATILMAGALALISGCGNKGALFIPEPPPEAQHTEQSPE